MTRSMVGKPVVGKDFFGRHAEVAELRRASAASHVLLLAPRRVGKTSLLRAVQDAERAGGEVCPVYVSVASARTEEDFVRLVLDAPFASPGGKRFYWQRARRRLSSGRRVRAASVAGTGVELDPSRATWQEQADRALLGLARAKRPWLFLVDELPLVILALVEADATGARARAFLQWFRHLRQHPEAGDRFRFVLAGSIGLDALARRHTITATINDLLIQRLGPFDDETADRFLTSLAEHNGLALADDVRQALCARVEWLIPYHLQALVDTLLQRRTLTPTVADVDAAVDAMLGSRSYFDTWYERLRDAVGASDLDHALAVLTTCALDPRGARLDTLRGRLGGAIVDPVARTRTIDWILDVLGNDGYVVEHDGRWRFRSALLRRYWERYHA